ncbi:hypothetical protein ABT072_48105 [Streptomyces sp. NPDC002589]|uniref:hypothetical protein n=1 Tax=Streptomyces sp. NPDC002589 TaxID=3154420 RepID=UPI003319CCD9
MNQTTVGSTTGNADSITRLGRPAAPAVRLGALEAVHAIRRPRLNAGLPTGVPRPAEAGLAVRPARVTTDFGRALV